MQRIREDRVRSRYASGLVRAVDLMCPHCRYLATFECGPWQEHGRRVTASEATCSNCDQEILLLQLLEPGGACAADGLYADPPSLARDPMAHAEHLAALSPALARTYESALKLYNQGDWGPSALIVRHLLGGLCTHLLGEDTREHPLVQQLDALPARLDLARPLTDIGPMFAATGAFGRHFDDEGSIDQALAEQLLDLMEHIVRYAVVMPATTTELRGRIASAPVPIRRSGSGAA